MHIAEPSSTTTPGFALYADSKWWWSLNHKHNLSLSRKVSRRPNSSLNLKASRRPNFSHRLNPKPSRRK